MPHATLGTLLLGGSIALDAVMPPKKMPSEPPSVEVQREVT